MPRPRRGQRKPGVLPVISMAPTSRLGHLLGIESLSRQQILGLLDKGATYAAPNAPQRHAELVGKTIITLFFENSTRTRTSFEIAARRLGADVISIATAASSTSKGETSIDTALNLEAMAPDAIVVRHSKSGAAQLLSRHLQCAIINAGDGQHEHPSQALLDAATIRAHKGELEGLEVAIVGDIQHSRVARSNVLCLTKLGCRVRLCAPHSLMPAGIDELGIVGGERRATLHYNLGDALTGADVVMALRVQTERLGETPRIADAAAYASQFGISARAMEHAKPDAIIMHPGPVNRGVELTADIADSSRSVILEQVSMGVAVRMAILSHILGDAT